MNSNLHASLILFSVAGIVYQLGRIYARRRAAVRVGQTIWEVGSHSSPIHIGAIKGVNEDDWFIDFDY